jgi:hypothetical protein
MALDSETISRMLVPLFAAASMVACQTPKTDHQTLAGPSDTAQPRPDPASPADRAPLRSTDPSASVVPPILEGTTSFMRQRSVFALYNAAIRECIVATPRAIDARYYIVAMEDRPRDGFSLRKSEVIMMDDSGPKALVKRSGKVFDSSGREVEGTVGNAILSNAFKASKMCAELKEKASDDEDDDVDDDHFLEPATPMAVPKTLEANLSKPVPRG